ncbi:MAG: hypothetical protein L0332_22265 [Chloroflexi bacterium]|nr:hypothetical protein [Chloroflexota bacterium]MCI0578990.1 hypothetical protein [Chloroflexota bacterium]MCI0648984.1 hypothetical protein [Chloroflexota bacterium]MCI0729419.1 hypothetical protein [Chloroflexota bacterium]
MFKIMQLSGTALMPEQLENAWTTKGLSKSGAPVVVKRFIDCANLMMGGGAYKQLLRKATFGMREPPLFEGMAPGKP